ncbi:MAG: hypothetical protein CMQ05_01060 [Gammaproteobacteria bacterium]|nr:hypothetical protein [Gammaproteobacteria bacterium]RPG25675.1 MAG: FAA hydrolase family protein [Gammaproteobacteria bacterium TMED50]|tara:strand:+ start:3032 stop:3730 length:699 start_codon:yes stop_codon:yes gene_type:complete
MTEFAITPNPPVTLPVHGSNALFPVAQIYCVGRNYADHAIEMGHNPDREAPFFFMKPRYAVLPEGGDMGYPDHTRDLHHEVELVVALSKGGRNVSVEDASSMIFGYSVGIDFTRRDLQGEAKEKGRPWEAGKTFVHAAPLAPITPITESGELNEGSISLSVNGDVRQSGNINQMIWKVPEVISRISDLFCLEPGDLIFTGTPAGVGAVTPGDVLEASVPGLHDLSVTLTGTL